MDKQEFYDNSHHDSNKMEGLQEKEHLEQHTINGIKPGEASSNDNRGQSSGLSSLTEFVHGYSNPILSRQQSPSLEFAEFIDWQEAGYSDGPVSSNGQSFPKPADYPSVMSNYHEDMIALARTASNCSADVQLSSNMNPQIPNGNGMPQPQSQYETQYLGLGRDTAESNLLNQRDIHHGQNSPPDNVPYSAIPLPSMVAGHNPYGKLVPSSVDMTHFSSIPEFGENEVHDEGHEIIARFRAKALAAGSVYTPSEDLQTLSSRSADSGAATFMNQYGLPPHELHRTFMEARAMGYEPYRTTQPTPMPSHSQPRVLPSSSRLPPTAATLLAGARNGIGGSMVLPWGYQRIKTLQRLSELAFKARVPMPPLPDHEIRKFFFIQASGARFTHMIKSLAPPVDVDIRLLGNIRVTAAELLTFFPLHVKWQDYMYRFIQNGWKPVEIAAYVNYSRQVNVTDAFRATTIFSYQQDADGEIIKNRKQGVKYRPEFKTTCFTTKSWRVPFDKRLQDTLNLCDYYLINLADGVVHFPINEHARVLTRAVQHAIQHGHKDAKLSELGAYVQKHGLRAGMGPMAWRGLKNGEHPDAAAKGALVMEIEQGRANAKPLPQKVAKSSRIQGKETL